MSAAKKLNKEKEHRKSADTDMKTDQESSKPDKILQATAAPKPEAPTSSSSKADSSTSDLEALISAAASKPASGLKLETADAIEMNAGFDPEQLI